MHEYESHWTLQCKQVRDFLLILVTLDELAAILRTIKRHFRGMQNIN
jgi:hypothetical protein